MRLLHVVPVLIVCSGFAAGCERASQAAAVAVVDCSTITALNTDDCIRLNQIQVLGTHNSYHIAPAPSMLAKLGSHARDIEYTHRSLTEQLSRLGIRQFELDVFADPEGGRFAKPAALRMVIGLEPPTSALLKPGFKVLHTPDVDYRTTCATLTACLHEIRDWSHSNPRHLPIQIQIEAKDSIVKDPDNLGFVTPIPIGVAELRALDAEILSVFSKDEIITPDRVRGSRATLLEAIRSDGWPRLGAARGKILFALDNTDQHRIDYLDGNPSLERRVLFVSSASPEPSAAFIKLNDALGAEGELIDQAVKAGFLIRTRADIPTLEARNGTVTRRDRAFRSGAQYVSTDYPEVAPFGSGYIARIPGAERLSARCNPVNAPAGCRHEFLESAVAHVP